MTALSAAHPFWHRPDLVIMDISTRELNGIDATSQIKAGASGYVVKDSVPHELSDAIRAASAACSAAALRAASRAIANRCFAM